MTEKRYPVGIQTFSEIIRGRYYYADKTDLVWQLQSYAKYIFLSRPRRFGKSLLSTTLVSYFRGERELFEGLKIMEMEREWKQYPVIHLDLSMAKSQEEVATLRNTLSLLIEPYERIYGALPSEMSPGMKLRRLIERASEQCSSQVVIIIDEYDAPLLDVLHDDSRLDDYRRVMQEFYQPLKASEALIRFCFITGITKFSQLSIFSTINNLTNITMLPRFATICGITDQELTTVMADGISAMAGKFGLTPQEMHIRLRQRYDGYHFAEDSEGVYNPYSLLNALLNEKLNNFWFDTGTPSFLIRQMQHFRTDITAMDNIEVPATAFDRPTEAMTDALPLLYQSGYLTIKGYDHEAMIYTLSIPNQEVRVGYADGLLPIFTGMNGATVQTGFALKFWRALKQGNADLAMRELQAYMAGLPYVEGFKKKLTEAATAEGFYEYTLYLIFSMLNVYVRTQVKCIAGRVDMVVWMPDTIYVFEMKRDMSAHQALQQIDDRGYAIPYQTDGRRVVKVGVRFNADTRVPEEWEIA
ncbi:MAG: ATP-binding protein [Prevotella sp.]|nr:ATP-binding protein [Prevotella sp.]